MRFHRRSVWLILFITILMVYVITIKSYHDSRTRMKYAVQIENFPDRGKFSANGSEGKARRTENERDLPTSRSHTPLNSASPNNRLIQSPEMKTNYPDVRVAVVLSLASDGWHIVEFNLLYNSWRFLQHFSPLSQEVLLDLIVFCEQPSCSQLPSDCLPLSLNKELTTINRCFYEELRQDIVNEWKSYLYMTSIAFMLTKEYREMIFKYRWVLRVDQDAVLSPGLLFGLQNKHGVKLHAMQFGGIGHGIDFTHERLRQIAKKLGYNHAGIHNLCSTWLVNPQDSITLANLTTIIGKHFLEKEFGQNVSGLESLPDYGEWPEWWRGVTSLYAAEIAINHFYYPHLTSNHESPAIDHPAHSTASVWQAWHIHCLHESEHFSKFEHRDQLHAFISQSQDKRIEMMSNVTITQNVLKEVINEFHRIPKGDDDKIKSIFQGKVAVNAYTAALAWQTAHAAVGAINL